MLQVQAFRTLATHACCHGASGVYLKTADFNAKRPICIPCLLNLSFQKSSANFDICGLLSSTGDKPLVRED